MLENAFEFVGCKAFVEKLVVKRQTAHGQKTTSIEHPSLDKCDGMDTRAGGKRELLRERL